MRGERRGRAGTLRTQLIFWNQFAGVGIVDVNDGPLPLPPSPRCGPRRSPARIVRGFCLPNPVRAPIITATATDRAAIERTDQHGGDRQDQNNRPGWGTAVWRSRHSGTMDGATRKRFRP